MENATIHGIMHNCYPTCIIPTDNLDEYSEIKYLARSHKVYTAVHTQSDTVSLSNLGMKNIKNALGSITNLNPLE